MGVHDLPDEPREQGAVIRVHNPDAKYPEIWVASSINGGAWYPDQETFLTGAGVRAFLKEHNDYPDYWHVAERGRVELLTVGDRGVYREGWRAGVRHVASLADNAEYDCPDYPDDEAEARAAVAAACTCPGCMAGRRCVDDQRDECGDCALEADHLPSPCAFRHGCPDPKGCNVCADDGLIHMAWGEEQTDELDH